uniref:Nose resistant-to-fluoxetine protein N-terminal domain-containing protein n=1 Tax=Timema bartmani TaxID=61472 RepID=A0A7R9EPY9_9NEOP|nr:unnamed protein product [Timema bartmani]
MLGSTSIAFRSIPNEKCQSEVIEYLDNLSNFKLWAVQRIGRVEFRGSEPAFAWRESGKPFRKITSSSPEREIRTSISPSSAVELNTTGALANYATEAVVRPRPHFSESGRRRNVETLDVHSDRQPQSPRRNWIMFDATSKFPVGVLQGAAYNLGNFDECLDVDNGANITGRYCLARIEFDSLKRRASDAGTAWEKLRVSGDSRKAGASNDRMKMRRNVFYHGVCFPSSCGATDVEYWLNTVLTTFQSSTQTKFRVEVSESMCQKKDEVSETLNVSQVVWEGYHQEKFYLKTYKRQPRYSGVGHDWLILRFKLLYDPRVQRETTCKRSFSLLRNWRQLTKQVDHNGDRFIACIDGLRVYTLIIIIIGHRGEAITSGPLINGNAVEQYYEEIGGAMIMNGHLVVDTFFTIGGFVLGWNILHALQKNKTISLFILYINRYIRLTPAYMTVVAFEAWFLYNLSSGPLWKYKAGRERDNCLNNWWTNALHINNYVQAEFPCIDLAWFIACDVQMFLCAPLFMILLVNKRRLGVAMLSLAIVASVVLPFTLTYVYNLDPTIIADPSPLVAVAIIAMGYEFYQPSLHLGRFGNAFYSGMHRTTFGACISFIIVACATGNGGIVARILEWKMLRPFSRLSYSVFLVHTVVQMVHYAAIRSPEYMNNTSLFDAQNLKALTYRRGRLMKETYVRPS